MKKLRVTLEGKSYDVLVEFLDEAPSAPVPAAQPVPVAAPVSAPAPVVAPVSVAAPVAKPAGAVEVRSPLAGKLVSLDVKPGQPVHEGTQVATVEAMKMNTYVFAPKDGTVLSLVATPGQAVDEAAVLLVIG